VRRFPQPLQAINPNTAGIDIGAAEIYVAVPPDRDQQSVRCFASFTRDLYQLAAWLKQCHITSVAMESTGIYWIPLYEILQHQGIEVCLVNARHLKNVSGKKTDVLDCQWLQQLHSYGLLTSSFRPSEEICRLRTIARQRDLLLRYRAAHIQHMQKALHLMNLQLDNVISDITGTTGMAIIRAILAGERNTTVLARYRDPHCRCTQEDIAKSLEGSYLDEHLFELQQAVELYDVYTQKIVACDCKLQALYQHHLSLAAPDQHPAPSAKRKKHQRHDPDFDLRACLFRLCGVDLTQVHGLNAVTVQTILSETGVDMSKWSTPKHYTSWLCVSPNDKVSGGRRLTTIKKTTTNRATQAYRLAARSLHHSKSALGAYYRRVNAKHGPAMAIKMTAHKLARIVYAMLTHKVEYKDLGEHYYELQYKERNLKRLILKAALFGFQLVPVPSTPALPSSVGVT
jgi:transposase